MRAQSAFYVCGEMMDDPKQLDPIEKMLRELGQAKQAGVFKQTDVDARSVLRDVRPRPLMTHVLAAAAVLALAVGVWTTAFRADPVSFQDGVSLATASLNPFSGERVVHFIDCMKGPADTTVPNECRDYDRDAGSTVDLRDFSQEALASATNP